MRMFHVPIIPACMLASTMLCPAMALRGQAAAQEHPAANQVMLKKGDRILFYGDSLTDQATKPKGWVTLLPSPHKVVDDVIWRP